MDLFGTAREAYEIAKDCNRWESDPPSKGELINRLALIRAKLTNAELALNSEMEINKIWKEADPNAEPLGFIYELGSIVVECLDISVAIEGDIEHAIDTRFEFDKTTT